MAWSVSAQPEKYAEALAWFESRVPYTREQFDQLDDTARRNAFYISGGLELGAVQTVLDEIKRNVEKGEPFEAFQKAVRDKLAGKLGPDGFHLETVYRNAVQASYNAGRWEQLTDPEMTLLRPYLMFDAVLDDRVTEICRALDGTIKAHDDPFWLTRCPALHHRCRSTLRSLRTSEARRRGITVGEPPAQVPDGWGKAPPLKASGDELKPKAERFDPEAWAEFTKRDARAMDELQVAQAAANDTRAKRKMRDPATYKEAEIARYQEAGPAVAWGKAAEQRGLQMTARKALDTHAELVKAGVHPSDEGRAAIRDLLDQVGGGASKRTMADLLDAAGQAKDLAGHVRGVSALAGHADAITPTPLGAIKWAEEIELAGNLKSEAEMKAAGKAMARFYAAMCDKSVVQPKGVVLQSDGRRRPEYHFVARELFVGNCDPEKMVHEWAHALEEFNEAMSTRALAFRRARTVGEQLEQLRLVDPSGSYEADEVTRRDKFYHPYMGKVYGASPMTEVTTMALQALVTHEAGDLAADDELTLYFALGQLAGGKLP